MKILLNEYQIRDLIVKKIISEIKIRKKGVFGMGCEHVIYDSSINPDVVFKLSNPYTINRWLGIFRKNPEYFPKVGKVGEFLLNGNRYMWVELERLETIKFGEKWMGMTMDLVDFGLIDEDNINMIDMGSVFRNCMVDVEYRERIFSGIGDRCNLFYEWYEFFVMVNNLVEPIKGNMLDIHVGNFGYDKSGKLKCLDI